MKFMTVLKIILARLRFVAVFLVAALIVGYWDNIKNHVDRWTRPAVPPGVGAHSHEGEIEYFCSMHPNIIRSEPGSCPICSMPLIKRQRGKAVDLPAGALARVQLTPTRLALAGVQTEGVEYRALSHEVRALGIFDYDETRMRHISARVAGRADELFLNFTGQSVRKGDRVYSLYSPEVYTAQREYLQARARVNKLAAGDAAADAAALYNASIQKLVLWGLTTEQLDAMEAEYEKNGKIPTHLTVTSPIDGILIRKDIDQGHYVAVGEDPYTLADTSVMWLQAKVYERDLPLVKVGQPVEVTLDALPNQTLTGRVAFLGVELNPQTRTLDVRVEVDNTSGAIKSGMFAQATLMIPVVDAPANVEMPRPENANPTTAPADAYSKALAPYLLAADALSKDDGKDVSKNLHNAMAALEELSTQVEFKEAYDKFESAVHETMGQDLPQLRETFKMVSSAMIELGKRTGVRAGVGDAQVFRCPMKKANWIQLAGDAHNPFYGSQMLDCGASVEPLPVRSVDKPSAGVPTTRPAGKVKSIHRDSVIDTGRQKVVYVESSPGLFDLHAVTLGPLAGDYYPVLTGLEESDRVVSRGAFLIDSENRLNPTRTR